MAQNQNNKNPADTFQALLDHLNFEDTAKAIDALKALIFDVPDISHAKIEFFKEEIASGRYEMDCTTIAEKMLAYHDIQAEQESM